MQHLPSIYIQSIDHGTQNYNTAGDYWEFQDKWHVRVSKLPDWRYEALVAFHELIEMCLTRYHGVSWDAITKFDTTGSGANSDDPGLLPEAPYHNEHMDADRLEREMAKLLGVDWDIYTAALDNLEYK